MIIFRIFAKNTDNMTQEDKELLLIDLCARLPYKPIVYAKWSYRETNGELKHKEADRKLEINDMYAIWDIKPYLRPMSSMTEEEKEEYDSIQCDFGIVRVDRVDEIVEFLLSHHFDYRGLIERGLALEAPEEIYNLNK